MLQRLRLPLFALAIGLLVIAGYRMLDQTVYSTSRTQRNFEKVTEGMPRGEVHELLGPAFWSRQTKGLGERWLYSDDPQPEYFRYGEPIGSFREITFGRSGVVTSWIEVEEITKSGAVATELTVSRNDGYHGKTMELVRQAFGEPDHIWRDPAVLTERFTKQRTATGNYWMLDVHFDADDAVVRKRRHWWVD